MKEKVFVTGWVNKQPQQMWTLAAPLPLPQLYLYSTQTQNLEGGMINDESRRQKYICKTHTHRRTLYHIVHRINSQLYFDGDLV